MEHDDDDGSWVEPDDDGGFVVDVEPGLLPMMTERLAHGSTAFSTELTVQVEGADGPRELRRDEIAKLIDDASSTCHDVLVRSPTTIDQTAAVELTQAAALLTTVWSLGLQADDPDGDDLRREMAWVASIGKLAADCEDMFVTRFRPRADGSFTLRWSVVDRAVVREAIADLRSLLTTDDPAIRRLFPAAYGSDAERNAGWDVLMRGELIERRLEALTVAETLMRRRRATADELSAFMRCINDARLVLGTRLDVDEDGLPGGSDRLGGATRSDRLVYESLTHLLGRTVDALETGLDGSGPDPLSI